jgi:hypothetical protein
MDGLVVAEVGLAVKVVVVIEIMEWSTVDQDANRRMSGSCTNDMLI